MNKGERSTISTKNAELDAQTVLSGASKSVLDYVTFVTRMTAYGPLERGFDEEAV